MINVLMCGSSLNYKGGMVSVVKNYLGYRDWNDYRITYVPTHTETNKYALAFYFVVRYVQITFMALSNKYRIAHLHTSERGSFWRKAILAMTLKMMGLKIVMHHHGAEFEKFYSTCTIWQKKVIKKVLESADLNLVLGEHFIDMIKEKAPEARTAVLYNAIHTYAGNNYHDEARYILHLGKLGKRKGTYDLLDVIKHLDTYISEDICFLLCGDGDIREIEQKICEYGVSHRIKYLGWVGKAQKEHLLAQTMLHVLPSYNEGLPMSILETMAYGIPNISTRIAAIPEIIKDGINGFLITPGDIGALTQKICMLIENYDLRKHFSQTSYDFISDKFTLQYHVERLKEFYNECLS